MPYSSETNREKQSDYYYQHRDEKLRKGVLERIMNGIRVVDKTLDKYKIKLTELPDKTKVHADVLKHLVAPPEAKKEEEAEDESMLAGIYEEYVSNSGLPEGTLKPYRSRLKAVKKMVAPDASEMGFYETLLEAKQCIAKIIAKQPYNYGDYLSPILSMAKYSPTFKAFLCESLDDYQKAFDEHKKQAKMALFEKMDKGTVVKWRDLLEMRDKIAKEEPYSQKHLLISLMTMIPTLRDDWGAMRLVTKSPIYAKNMEKYNYYNMKEGKIYLYKYKGCARKGVKVINVPTELQKVIEGSLKHNQRDWMVTKYDNTQNDKYARDKLSNLIKEQLGYTINEFRHSLETYIHNNPNIKPSEVLAISESMLHSAAMGLMYVRDGEVAHE